MTDSPNTVNFRLFHHSLLNYLTSSLADNSLSLADVRLVLSAKLYEFKGRLGTASESKARSRHRYSLSRCDSILASLPRLKGKQFPIPYPLLSYLIDSATKIDTLVILSFVPYYMTNQERVRIHQRQIALSLGIHHNSVNNTIKRLVRLSLLSPLSPSTFNHPTAIQRHGKAYTYCNRL
jgi:hypothetical protein